MERPKPALLLRLLIQRAGDFEMNPAPDSTQIPTNCLRLMQWNANRISVKFTEISTFLHSRNVNISAIQETKLTNKAKPLKTPGLAAVPLYRLKSEDCGLLMPIKYMIPFVDITAALPQSADPHLEKQGISITMPNRLQLHIHNIYISPRSCCSAGHNTSIAHTLSNNEMSLIVGLLIRITPDGTRRRNRRTTIRRNRCSQLHISSTTDRQMTGQIVDEI